MDKRSSLNREVAIGLVVATLLAVAMLAPSLAEPQSAFGGAFPATGTPAGAKDSTTGKMVPLKVDATGALVTSGGSMGPSSVTTVTQGTNPWVVSQSLGTSFVVRQTTLDELLATVKQGDPNSIAQPWPVILSDGISAYEGAKTQQLPLSIGPQINSASLSIVPAIDAHFVTSTSTVATALASGTCTDVTGSTTVLAADAARRTAVILNAGAANVHVKLGATATTSNPPLAPGQALTIDGNPAYTGVIDAIAASGTQSVCVYAY